MEYNAEESTSEVQRHEDWVELTEARGPSDENIYNDGYTSEEHAETESIMNQVKAQMLPSHENVKKFAIGLIISAMIWGYYYHKFHIMEQHLPDTQ